MKSTNLLLPLAVLLAGAGCFDSEDEAPERCTPVVSGGMPQPPSAFLPVGQPSAVRVLADIPHCMEQQAPSLKPDTVTSEVYGPGNILIPSDVVLSVETAPPSATLRFIPPVPGAYHAIISFAPVGGLQQLELLAGADRRQAVIAVELSRTACAHVDRTSKGTWLCDSAALSPGAQQWQTLGNYGKVAVTGDVVWVTEPGRVQRFVDTGTSLQLTARLDIRQPLLDDTSSRLATEDELVLRSGDWVHRITYTQDQGLTAHPTFRWPVQQGMEFGTDYIRGLLVRSGERVLWVYNESQGPGSQSKSHACPLQLGEHGGFVVSDAPCQPLPGVPVGSEPGVLWLRTFETERSESFQVFRETLHRWVAREGRMVEQAVLPLHLLADIHAHRPLGAGDTTPVLFQRAAAYPVPFIALPTWSVERDALELELFPRYSGGSLRASPRFLWTFEANASVRVVER